ncbi:MAG: DNA-3-methyladenine glycosylase 2 family protein [Ruminococcus sp.]|nr:DNA-3-methyladenine glycosylase 2 family protein [Ruminococcus sp.]
MNVIYKNDSVIITEVSSFNLEQIFECGQCFRWNKTDCNTYGGVAFGKALTISQKDTTVTLQGCNKNDFENVWYSYFDLGVDYDGIKSSLASLHPVLKEAQQYAPGIRILSQEPWEALCSFIISQNNNIPRIKGIIDRLCRQYGEPIGDNLYAFPTAERLSCCTVDDFAPLRSGFRAKYIVDAATKVATDEINLHEIKKMPVEQARKELMKIKGVGPKVADCTMLYGMGKKECFPMDVWMKRAMEVLFPNLTPEDFGTNAGIAQQYIFHYSRMNPQLFEQS